MATNVYITSSSNNNLSRNEMMNWVNSELMSNFMKIEEMGAGTAYCQLIDILFPGIVPMKRVKWNPRSEHEYLHNFKVLQQAFKDVSIDKMIPIEKLVKLKFQDNFEFAQWFKKFFDANYQDTNDEEYDPLKRRGHVQLGKGTKKLPSATNVGIKSKPTNLKTIRSANLTTATTRLKNGKESSSQLGKRSANVITNNRTTVHNTNNNNNGMSGMSTTGSKSSEFKELKQKSDKMEEEMSFVRHELERVISYNDELEFKLSDANQSVIKLENERDYYYKRLIELENFCLNFEENETAKSILDILYKNEELEETASLGPSVSETHLADQDSELESDNPVQLPEESSESKEVNVTADKLKEKLNVGDDFEEMEKKLAAEENVSF
ncbi:hypothetical protein SNEBB_005875 [Seison nebaliae]|nr:hypothetical protein SNEBB_005875 [Seison nebaliae]